MARARKVAEKLGAASPVHLPQLPQPVPVPVDATGFLVVLGVPASSVAAEGGGGGGGTTWSTPAVGS